jgi:hypothetical protein
MSTRPKRAAAERAKQKQEEWLTSDSTDGESQEIVDDNEQSSEEDVDLVEQFDRPTDRDDDNETTSDGEDVPCSDQPSADSVRMFTAKSGKIWSSSPPVTRKRSPANIVRSLTGTVRPNKLICINMDFLFVDNNKYMCRHKRKCKRIIII